MSGEFEIKGNVFTTLLKYKQKYGNAELEFIKYIPRSYVKKILHVKKLSSFGKLVEEGGHYVLDDVAVVYEDDKKQVRIAFSVPWAEANEIEILKNIEIVITNKIEMLKKIIQEAVMKKEKDNFIVRLFYYYYYNVAYPPDGKITYYTDVIKVNGYMLPDRGFFYANGNIYTDDLEVLRFAAKYIVELNGIKVNNLKELVQMFMKFKDKFYITEDTLANFKGNEVVSLIETCAVPLYLENLVIYTNDFNAEIGCGLILKKGVIAFSYEWVAASPDVWQTLSTSL
jgi:hypothetical protein